MTKVGGEESWSEYFEAITHMEEKDNLRFNQVANITKQLKFITVCYVTGSI